MQTPVAWLGRSQSSSIAFVAATTGLHLACIIRPGFDIEAQAVQDVADGFMKRVTRMVGQREQQRLQTRDAILNAVESIMLEEGYAAVSSRRIGVKAGLKSQLVHYHFGNMDEMFVALYRRSEEAFFRSILNILSSPKPLTKLWGLAVDTDSSALVLEFTALASHRKKFREELVRSASRARALENAVLLRVFNEQDKVSIDMSASVLSFVILSISRALTMENSLGITDGHEEILDFVKGLILKMENRPPPF